MRFPPAFLDELRARLLPSEIIGRRITLRRAGREFQACCPFHNEKTPSFYVNDAKGFFHCFGCGAHGDVIGFVKDYERLTYPEAVERLAGEAGLPLPKMSQEAEAQARAVASLAEVVQEAARWFREQLAGAAGREVRAYLEGRGLARSTVERFGLGFAPDHRTALKDALMKRGISEKLLIDAGLIIRPDNGPTYDRFRARVIFPIQDARGRLIAFGGRLLPGHDGPGRPKYLNSPDTELFHKGRVLYGLNVAREAAAKKPLLIAEGYMDVIALHQAGFTTAVAPLGTAITPEHLMLAWKATDEPILCLDGDAAGARAMTRAAKLSLPLLTPGKSLRFLRLPRGEDPDSLIKTHGPAAFEALLAAPMPLHDSLWQGLLPSGGLKTPEQRAVFERDVLALTNEIKDATVQKHYRDHFRTKLWELSSGGAKRAKERKAKESRTLPPLVGGDPVARCERQALALLLLLPDLLRDEEVAESLASLDLADPLCAELAPALLDFHHLRQQDDGADLAAHLQSHRLSPTAQSIARARDGMGTRVDNPQALWQATLHELSLKTLEREIREATLTAHESEEAFSRLTALQRQYAALAHAMTG